MKYTHYSCTFWDFKKYTIFSFNRYFDHRIRALLRTFKNNKGVFKENYCKDYYWRVEVQQRGSLHLHGLFWLNDAPQWDRQECAKIEEVVKFIDAHVTTDVDRLTDNDLKDYQTHKHTRTCERELKGSKICRFNLPKPPMKRTEILFPLDETFSRSEINLHRQNFQKIKDSLNEMDAEAANITFEEFLQTLEMGPNEYLLAIRSSLKAETTFLQRKPRHMNGNAFNVIILELHRANMDIQFILNPYGLQNYLVNYLKKAMKGISKLLHDAIEETRRGNYSIQQKLLKISKYFVNGVEISAQEAAYTLLGLHMSESSVAVVFVNTFPPEKRVKMLKPKKELEKLPPNSTNIYCSSLLE